MTSRFGKDVEKGSAEKDAAGKGHKEVELSITPLAEPRKNGTHEGREKCSEKIPHHFHRYVMIDSASTIKDDP